MCNWKLYYSLHRLLYGVVLVTKIKGGVWRQECSSCSELVFLAVLFSPPSISLRIFTPTSDTPIDLFWVCLLTQLLFIKFLPLYLIQYFSHHQVLSSVLYSISAQDFSLFPVLFCVFCWSRMASVVFLLVCFWHRLFPCYFFAEKELFFFVEFFHIYRFILCMYVQCFTVTADCLSS